MTKKYKVLKDFTTSDGYEYTIDGGCFFITNAISNPKYTEYLIGNGFIEEIKESSRWRAGIGDYYYLVDWKCEVKDAEEIGHFIDRDTYDLGNYFRSEETATKVSEALKLFFQYIHEEDGDSWGDMVDVFDTARAAVLADDKES